LSGFPGLGSSVALREIACVGVPPVPRVVRWTDHAIPKAHALGVTQADVEAVVL